MNFTTTIIKAICAGCQCDKETAQEYLDGELRHLADLSNLGDLRHSDIENACSGLGLAADYEQYFVERLANCDFSMEDEDSVENMWKLEFAGI